MVSAAEVIAVGATGLSELTSSLDILHALRIAYSESVRYTFVLALAAACFAFPFSCAMENLNIKHISEERSKKSNQTDVDTTSKDSPSEVIELDEEQGGGIRGHMSNN